MKKNSEDIDMPSMKDMAVKYKMSKEKGPGAQKKHNKTRKKEIDRALKQAMTLSVDGQIAVINDGKNRHIMLREDKLNEAIGNLQKGLGFVVNPSKELIEYTKLHQEVLTVLSKLNYEELDRDQFETDEDYEVHKKIVKRNEEMFAAFDEWTFDFSEGLMKGEVYRKDVSDRYREFRKKWPTDEILKSKVVESSVV